MSLGYRAETGDRRKTPFPPNDIDEAVKVNLPATLLRFALACALVSATPLLARNAAVTVNEVSVRAK